VVAQGSSSLNERLPSLRDLVSRRPEAIYLDAADLARLLNCSEQEAEEARHWIVVDGLEVLG
jgi:hypothetical protein